ncbi:hypothetical protein CSKR_102418 [Clonorchis sinensis]|uniref:Uncharacterized protein n=1 Tax=Clonorchis sinensis TaxID=79923 RepID=A0A3R7CPJ2_CLOSI|nr:hypothetical protein CSKR_102418 [Clonorchis sinensis]
MVCIFEGSEPRRARSSPFSTSVRERPGSISTPEISETGGEISSSTSITKLKRKDERGQLCLTPRRGESSPYTHTHRRRTQGQRDLCPDLLFTQVEKSPKCMERWKSWTSIDHLELVAYLSWAQKTSLSSENDDLTCENMAQPLHRFVSKTFCDLVSAAPRTLVFYLFRCRFAANSLQSYGSETGRRRPDRHEENGPYSGVAFSSGTTRLPEWGPLDPHCACLEMMQDVAAD